jgi:hypothetical protein
MNANKADTKSWQIASSSLSLMGEPKIRADAECVAAAEHQKKTARKCCLMKNASPADPSRALAWRGNAIHWTPADKLEMTAYRPVNTSSITNNYCPKPTRTRFDSRSFRQRK